MRQKGFISTAIMFIIVGALIVTVGLYYVLTNESHEQQQRPVNVATLPISTSSQPVGTVASSTSTTSKIEQQVGEIDTTNWKTYKDEEFGFEFQYPSAINGALVQIAKEKDIDMYVNYRIFSGTVSTSSRYINYSINMKLYDLKYPSLFFKFPKTTQMNEINKYFNNQDNNWYQNTNQNNIEKISWDDIFKYLQSNILIAPDWPMLNTADGVTAYPNKIDGFGDQAMEGIDIQYVYNILSRKKLIYLSISYGEYGSLRKDMQIEEQNSLESVQKLTIDIVRTVRFD